MKKADTLAISVVNDRVVVIDKSILDKLIALVIFLFDSKPGHSKVYTAVVVVACFLD